MNQVRCIWGGLKYWGSDGKSHFEFEIESKIDLKKKKISMKCSNYISINSDWSMCT